MHNKVPLRNLYEWLAGCALLFYIGVAPLYKYGEYVYDFPRLNVTLVMLLFFSMIGLIGLARFICSKHEAKEAKFGVLALLSSILILWISVLQLVQFPFLVGEVDLQSILIYSSRTLIASSVLFLVGINLESIVKSRRKEITFFWGLSVLAYLFGIYKSSGFFVYLGGEPIYLMLSDAFLLLSFLIIFAARTTGVRVALFLISFVILVALLSRSAVLLFVVSFFGYLLFRHSVKAVLALFASLVMLALGWVYVLDLLGESNRIVRFFVSGEDSSFSTRVEQITSGVGHLKDNWLLGKYMYDVVIYGNTGSYAHNFLSFWTAYGIGPFFLLIVVGFLVWLKFLISKEKSSYYGLVFVILLANFIAIIISKSYLYPYIWLAIGAGVGYCESRRIIKHKECVVPHSVQNFFLRKG